MHRQCRYLVKPHRLPDAQFPELQQAELQTLLQRLVLQLQRSGVGAGLLRR